MTTESKNHLSPSLRIIQFLNDYSVMVSLGAVSTAWFFLRWYHISSSPFFLWLLGSSTWLIFTVDHLLDARNPETTYLSSRHQKHRKNANILLWPVSLLSGFNLMIVWLHIDAPYVIPGLIAAAFMALYFILTHFRKSIFRFKEIWVAAGATIGMCILPSFSGISDTGITISHGVVWLIFFLIHLVNIITFSRFSLQEDLRSGMVSIASAWGFRKTSKTLFNLILFTYFITIFWILLFNDPIEMHISLMILLILNGLALINFRYYTFKKNDLYRFWGDAMYLIPGFLSWMLR